jgi:hypothetical protein
MIGHEAWIRTERQTSVGIESTMSARPSRELGAHKRPLQRALDLPPKCRGKPGRLRARPVISHLALRPLYRTCGGKYG